MFWHALHPYHPRPQYVSPLVQAYRLTDWRVSYADIRQSLARAPVVGLSLVDLEEALRPALPGEDDSEPFATDTLFILSAPFVRSEHREQDRALSPFDGVTAILVRKDDADVYAISHRFAFDNKAVLDIVGHRLAATRSWALKGALARALQSLDRLVRPTAGARYRHRKEEKRIAKHGSIMVEASARPQPYRFAHLPYERVEQSPLLGVEGSEKPSDDKTWARLTMAGYDLLEGRLPPAAGRLLRAYGHEPDRRWQWVGIKRAPCLFPILPDNAWPL